MAVDVRREQRHPHRLRPQVLIGTALLVGALVMAGCVPPPPPPPPGATVTPQPLDEVRPFDTNELGVPHPEGVAYDAASNRFAIAATGDASTKVALTSPYEDPLGGTALPAADPATLATDPVSGTLGVQVGDDRLSVGPGLSATAGAGPDRSKVTSGIAQPAGAAYDEAGNLFVLDPQRRLVVRVARDGSGASEISLAQLPGSVPLRGLAVNPADGLIYVGSPEERLVYGIDTAGTLQQAYDLSPLGLADQQGFTFAPSADTTDDPGVQHLFVADSGDGASLGSVMEASSSESGPARGLQAQAAVAPVTATLVQRIATSAWSPASPDPSGIEYLPGPDRLVVVDSEVDETTGAGYHNVNLWQVTRSGVVADTGTTWTPAPAYSKEPTGLGVDASTNTLYVSDDSYHRIWIDRIGPDNRFGTADDIVTSLNPTIYGSNDTEDPEFDPTTGHLFFIDGVNVEVYEIDPVDGVFGNGNDTMTHFDMAQYGPNDIEGLGSDPVTGNLLVGGRTTKKIYEVTKQGALVQTIDASGVSGLRYISGLVQAPASDGSGRRNYWTVDRNIDNGSNSSENDGQLFELSIPSAGNAPPLVNAGTDQTITLPTTSANLSGSVVDDGQPSPPGATTNTWSQVSGPASVTFGDASNPVTTANGLSVAGDYVLRLTANDSALSGSDDITVHVVANQAPTVDAGQDQTITLPTTSANLSGSVVDDGQPSPPGATTKTWSQVSGPASVTFGDASNPVTTVNGLSVAGDYVLRLTANDSALSGSDDITVHVSTGGTGGTVTLDVPAVAGSDDAEQATSGSVNITSTDLDLVVDGTTPQSAIGVRFPNVTVPVGATIQSAYVQFRVDETGSTATSLLVQGQAVDSAPTFTTQKNNITSRARTVASAVWNPPAWPTLLAHGVDQQTSDLAPIVQEIVVRPGWVNGNAMAMIITGSGQRVADSVEGAFAPVLHIVYSTGGPPPNQRPVVNAGSDQTITLPAAANLAGSATDDGLPNPPGTLVHTWTQVSGPGTAVFADPHAAATSASFDLVGTYVLRLSTSDSALTGVDDVTVTVLGPGSVVTRDFPIAVGSDDAEQLPTTSVNITSGDLDMMLDGTVVQTAVGLRFANVTLPPGATIVGASVQFRSDEAHSDATSLLIQGQAAADPPTFTTAKNGITSRARTAASAQWNPVPWTKTTETGPAEQTPSLVPIVQELVSQPGWASGNAMVLIITGSGRRVADSFEGSAPAFLRVSYQL